MSNPESPHPAELCLQRMFEKTEKYVRREPAQAVAVAFGAGLLLKLLPARTVVRPITAIAVRLLPPTLLGLGLLKAFELCCQKNRGQTSESRSAESP